MGFDSKIVLQQGTTDRYGQAVLNPDGSLLGEWKRWYYGVFSEQLSSSKYDNIAACLVQFTAQFENQYNNNSEAWVWPFNWANGYRVWCSRDIYWMNSYI